MSAGRIRSLAPSELFFAMAGAYIGYSVRVRGALDITALSTAFAALRRRYPALAATLEPEDGGFVIVAGSGPLPGVVVTAGDLDAPISTVCADQTRALSGLHVTRDGDRSAVTLFTHHSIADGYHSLDLLADLWALYTATVHGVAVDDAVWEYPESLEKVLADRGICKADRATPPAPAPQPTEDETTTAVAPGRGPSTSRVFATTSARCRLDPAATAALLAFARRNDTTLNAVLSAVIMRVESELGGVPSDRIAYTYPVNLRSRLSPPVANPAATNPLGFAEFTPTADLTDTVAIAHKVNDSLRNGLETNDIHQSGLSFFENMSAAIAEMAQIPASERPIAIVSTNWGIVPPPHAPTHLEFEDFRSLMIETPIDPNTPFAPPGTYIISTFQNRLAIELRLPTAPEAAQKRTAAIESTLRTLI
ncbi:hypothetical protein JK358_10600 [Nocardia sp. 2]|uniref:Phthiocerol/phthiodiolone dimycocerosyl transferase n=1 Tax=Nocardia acididurans TaxID=2802282 RepID=A0ABS1M3D8_9NOCA|nr:hypothetical protein [Nocardia acididurans]MBL1074841.1 hypothetical protein [Nocardia acididurans]